MRRLAAVAILVLATLTACSDEKLPAPSPVAWTKVDTPAEPVTLTAHDDQLLIGLRHRGAKVVPELLLQDSTGKPTPITVKPNPASPYAFEAIWYSIAYDGKQILALGGAAGGAHSNTRWTVWSGTPQTGLIEQPQDFFTFGGQTAGDLYSAVITPSGRALLGSWGGVVTGNDAMVWLPQGNKWTRQDPTKTALQSTPNLLVGPGFGTTLGESILLFGSQVRLAPNVVAQEAAVWRSTKLNQGWSRIVLPDPGNRSQANTATCAKDCVISGYVDGQLALWQLDASGTAKRLQGVPSVPVGDKDKLPPPVVDGSKIIQIVAQDNKVKVLTDQDGHWTVQDSQGPDGQVTDAVLMPDHKLYLIAGTSLWQTTLS
ncbi:hypothetical protein [Kribbella jiaozuonensis]|uniref:Uncharacterized protein n=1 Tax=Kribbella jiaozuonensis TaxID=2575441 RepID=A0A4U3M3L0_9ACTN|nr:hypothetical protein [Kribbella jiaozuonensis]TKK79211.1 hypothetical protein FDA38_12335 [Kribbella jiaozuonensis]TKK83281.1 hypothetical protein FDA38_11290 [Kribbella jiaozuonensis]